MWSQIHETKVADLQWGGAITTYWRMQCCHSTQATLWGNVAGQWWPKVVPTPPKSSTFITHLHNIYMNCVPTSLFTHHFNHHLKYSRKEETAVWPWQGRSDRTFARGSAPSVSTAWRKKLMLAGCKKKRHLASVLSPCPTVNNRAQKKEPLKTHKLLSWWCGYPWTDHCEPPLPHQLE